MKSKKINFTDARIRDLPPADTGERYIVYDESIKWLIVRVNDKGNKVFYVYKKLNGSPLKVKLNDFSPAYGVEKARKDAITKLDQIKDGNNPNDEKKRIRADMTLKEFWDTHYVPRHGKYKAIRTQETDNYGFDNYLKPLHNKKMLMITHDQVDLLHKKIGDECGIYTANRVLAVLRNVYNKALEWGCFTGTANPAMHIGLFDVEHRDRFLQADEMERFVKALDSDDNEVFKNFIWASLLTGQRRGNVQAYRWEDIDFENKTLYIKKTKNGQPLRLPLTQQAMDLFTRMRETATGPWLFPSATSQSGHLEEPKNRWKALLKSANIENLRIHDLRRTYGSYQAITGASMLVIGKSLGHKSQQSTEIYSRLSMDPVRESVQTATDKMFDLAKSEK